jgi:hypothetical protein
MVILSAGFMSCTKTNFPAPNTNGDYSVFAWNDLGMHCINPSYDKLVILPPYNNVLAQVVRRGSPPELVTEGITVSYRIIDNTSSYNKRLYGGFWDFSNKLFGVTLTHNIGLKGNGLSGNMTAAGDHFIAEGIPVVPVNDADVYNPYQVAEITVKDGSGNTLTQTRTTVPVSDEISCAKCHGSDAFTAILSSHDDAFGTNFSATGNQPVLCASCHPSPALGINTGSQMYLSRAIHGSHASKPGITCYDCHPGSTAKCNRSIKHTSDNGNCTTCHGDMANVASTIAAGRIPWATEPLCVTCHTGVTGVNTGVTLFRNSQGHGDMYCSACHGSPHAMYPSSEASDNYQSKQYQGFSNVIKTIGSCGVCHNSSRGESKLSEFEEVHGRTNPEEIIGCSACHTSISATIARWPHAYTWKDSN